MTPSRHVSLLLSITIASLVLVPVLPLADAKLGSFISRRGSLKSGLKSPPPSPPPPKSPPPSPPPPRNPPPSPPPPAKSIYAADCPRSPASVHNGDDREGSDVTAIYNDKQYPFCPNCTCPDLKGMCGNDTCSDTSGKLGRWSVSPISPSFFTRCADSVILFVLPATEPINVRFVEKRCYPSLPGD